MSRRSSSIVPTVTGLNDSGYLAAAPADGSVTGSTISRSCRRSRPAREDPPVPTDPGALVDRLEITETLCRYATALDARDYDSLRTVFADDVAATYGEREPMHGVDAVVDWIAGYGRQQAWQHHLVSVYRVSVDGDAATALTYVTATQAASADPDAINTTHGRYHDSLRRIDGAWRITQRRMEVVRRFSRNVSGG
jgi:hypothetical protein